MYVNSQRFVLTEWQAFFFSLLRIAIGWHFLREGVIKLVNPSWTAAGYLMGSWGPFSGLFNQMGASAAWMSFINIAMPVGLTLVGLGLLLGALTRLSALGGVILLAMFYVATPPFDFPPTNVTEYAPFRSSVEHALWAGKHAINTEGNFWLVNKNLIELIALLAIMSIPPSIMWGLDAVISPVLARVFKGGSET